MSTITATSDADASQLADRIEQADDFSCWEDVENALMGNATLHNRYQVLLEQYKRRCFEEMYSKASSDEQTAIRAALGKYFGDTLTGGESPEPASDDE